MNLYNLIITSLKAIQKNGFRSFLTMLGIIIGVSAVIVMLSIGKGTELSINAEIATLGTNLIMINPSAAKSQGVKMEAGSQQNLNIKDIEVIKKYSRTVKSISPVIRAMAQLKYLGNNWHSSIMGVSSDYLAIRDIKLLRGSPFTEHDVKTLAKVCLIGKTVRENLFGKKVDPIGKVIRVGNIPFKVIGILKDKGQSSFGQDQDDIILSPYTSVQNRITGTDYLQQIYISSLTNTDVAKTVAEITFALRQSHNLSPDAEDDFVIHTQSELNDIAKNITNIITALLGSVAAISLLVGGIGIMNIMFVSVTERTREIGLRLAIGATGFDVLMQMLLEAIVLSLVGGILGVTLGVILSHILSSILGFDTIVTWFSIVLSFSVCTFIGVFFGWYPARKAARLNPIDALRFE